MRGVIVQARVKRVVTSMLGLPPHGGPILQAAAFGDTRAHCVRVPVSLALQTCLVPVTAILDSATLLTFVQRCGHVIVDCSAQCVRPDCCKVAGDDWRTLSAPPPTSPVDNTRALSDMITTELNLGALRCWLVPHTALVSGAVAQVRVTMRRTAIKQRRLSTNKRQHECCSR